MTVSEVHRYKVVTMLSEDGNKISYKPHGPEVVTARDFDAAQSELTALKAELASEEKDHAELRDVVAALRATNKRLNETIQHMVDQTIPLVPDESNPMWSRRITIDELQVELASVREELNQALVDHSEALRGEDVLAERLNAAQSELAALREELAESKSQSAEYGRAFNAQCRKTDSLNQRLLKATDFVERLYSSAGNQPSVATGYLRDILDALKPTESGASECDPVTQS